MSIVNSIKAAAVVGAVLGAMPAVAQSVSLVTTSAGSFTNSTGSAVAKVLNEEAGIRAVVTPQQGSGLTDINEGLADFGFTTIPDLYFAVTGAKDYESIGAHENLRLVARLTPLRGAAYVLADSDIQTFADLKGRRMPCEFAAQPSGNVNLNAIRAIAGVSVDDVECVPAQNIPGGADLMASDKVDFFYFGVGSGKVKEVAAAVGGLRALSVPEGEEALAAARQHIPFVYGMAVAANPNLDGFAADTNVLANDLLMFTHAGTSDELVKQIVATLHENKAGLAEVFGPLGLFGQEQIGKVYEGVPYHDGAIAFFQEKGYWN